MPSSRILVPAGFAVVCAGALAALLVWQLNQTKLLLREQTAARPGDTIAADADMPLPSDLPVDPRDEALLHLRKGDIFALQGEWAAAQDEFERSVAAGGGLSALRKLAQAQLQRRDVRGARATLEQLKRSGAKNEDILLLESIILLRTGEVAGPRDLLANAVESPQKHYGGALLSIIEGNHEQAKADLAAVEAGWEPVLRSYARTLLSAYEEYALFPESPNIHLITLLSRSLAQVQECELALPLLSQVTQQQDDYRDAWIVQGFCELMTERHQESLASLERAYAIDPQKPEIQYFLARAFAALGDHKNAATFLQYALRNGFEPEKEARRLLAKEAIEVGDGALALEQYDALTQLPDADVGVYDGYVSAALTLDKKDEAYVKASEAAEKWPQDGLAWELKGIAALETGRDAEGKEALRKALEIDPTLTRAKQRLGGA